MPNSKKHNAVIEQELRYPGIWEIIQPVITYEYGAPKYSRDGVIQQIMSGTIPYRLSRHALYDSEMSVSLFFRRIRGVIQRKNLGG